MADEPKTAADLIREALATEDKWTDKIRDNPDADGNYNEIQNKVLDSLTHTSSILSQLLTAVDSLPPTIPVARVEAAIADADSYLDDAVEHVKILKSKPYRFSDAECLNGKIIGLRWAVDKLYALLTGDGE